MQMRLKRASETLSLSGGDSGSTIQGCQYLDQSADSEKEEITETVEVVLEGTAANVLNDERTIERWIEEAIRYQDNQLGERVWLEYDVIDTGDWYRSEVLGGMVSRSTNMGMLKGGQLQIGVQIRRVNAWEALTEVSVPISNGNGTNVTSGLPVFNCSDGAGTAPAMRHNYAHIAAGVIDGTLPALARLEMVNTFVSGVNLETIWVGHNFSSDPSNLAHVLEAEAATGGTAVLNSGSSGGYYTTVVAPEGSEQTLLTWTLSEAFLSATRGRFFQVFMRRTFGIDANMMYALALWDGTAPIWVGSLALVKNSTMLINLLDVVPLPPGVPGQNGQRSLALKLSGKHATAGSLSVFIDCLMLMAMDSYRQYASVGYGLAQGRRLIDDPVDGTYSDDGAGGLRRADFATLGRGIWLEPRAAQRLYFLMHGQQIGDGPIDRSLSVVLKYRPRRLRL